METTQLRVMVSYAYLVFSQPPKRLHQAMLTRKPFFIHNVAPRNEHVSIIFGVNRSEASFFTIKFFNFQVHFPCKWELFFEIKKETSCEIDKVRK